MKNLIPKFKLLILIIKIFNMEILEKILLNQISYTKINKFNNKLNKDNQINQ